MFQRLYNAYGRGMDDQMADLGAPGGSSSSLGNIDPRQIASSIPSFKTKVGAHTQDDLDDPLIMDQSSISPIKRSATGDGEDESSKRVRLSEEDDTDSSCHAPIESSDSPCSTPHARVTADDFVAECVRNGINFESGQAPSSNFAPVSNDEQSQKPPTRLNPPGLLDSILPLPIEAIETIQEASSDMLKALIKKELDREKQMLVAVGTIRTCLEVHFLPHLNTWKQASDGRRQATKVMPPVNEGRRRDDQMVSRLEVTPGILTRLQDADQGDLRLVVQSLQEQLSVAGVDAEILRKDAKDKDLEIARLKAETRRLSNQLISAKTQASKPPIPSVKSETELALAAVNEELRKTIQSQKEKIKNQTVMLTSLDERWKKVKSLDVQDHSGHNDSEIIELKRIIDKHVGTIQRQAKEITNLLKRNVKPTVKDRKKAELEQELGQMTREGSRKKEKEEMEMSPRSNQHLPIVPRKSLSNGQSGNSLLSIHIGPNKQSSVLLERPVLPDNRIGPAPLRWQDGDFMTLASPIAEPDPRPVSPLIQRIDPSHDVTDHRSPWERNLQTLVDQLRPKQDLGPVRKSRAPSTSSSSR